MANYATLKAAIAAAIKQNGNNEITGTLLQQQLLAMVNSLGVGYQYVGIATPATNPGTPDQNVFYIASTDGTYTNFDGLVLADGEIAILKYNGAWSKDSTGIASLENVNQLGQYVDNPEWVRVVTDANNYILYGVKTDGKFYFGAGCPPQVMAYISEYGYNKSTIDSLFNTKVDKVAGKSLIDADFASSQEVIENPEWLEIKTDNEGKVLWGRKKNGTVVENCDVEYPNGMPSSIKNYIDTNLEEIIENIENIFSKPIGTEKINTINKIIAYLKKLPNDFSGKKISILGDSISTFNGYLVDPNYIPYYPRNDRDVDTVDDTWWMQVINNSNALFEKNAASSGSTASSFLLGFSPRVPLLGQPDIIFIALGTNDWIEGVTIGDIDYDAVSYDLTKFAPAYVKGMQDTIAAYPNALLFCLSFNMADEYANTIKEIANHYGAYYIDAREEAATTHPYKSGMTAIANEIGESAFYTLKDETNRIPVSVENLPISDGTNISSGKAYIDSVTRVVKVKE